MAKNLGPTVDCVITKSVSNNEARYNITKQKSKYCTFKKVITYTESFHSQIASFLAQQNYGSQLCYTTSVKRVITKTEVYCTFKKVITYTESFHPQIASFLAQNKADGVHQVGLSCNN